MSDTPTPETPVKKLQESFSKAVTAYKEAKYRGSNPIAFLPLALFSGIVIAGLGIIAHQEMAAIIAIALMPTGYVLSLVGAAMYLNRPSKMEPLRRNMDEAGNAYGRAIFGQGWIVRYIVPETGDVLATPLDAGGVDISGITFYARHTGMPGPLIDYGKSVVSFEHNAAIMNTPWYQDAMNAAKHMADASEPAEPAQTTNTFPLTGPQPI